MYIYLYTHVIFVKYILYTIQSQSESPYPHPHFFQVPGPRPGASAGALRQLLRHRRLRAAGDAGGAQRGLGEGAFHAALLRGAV